MSDVVVGMLRVRAGAGPLAAGMAALMVATAVSFAGNRYWTFRHRARTTVGQEGLRYLALSATGLVIQLACLRLAGGVLGLHGGLPYGLALATAIALGGLFRYWSCRAWVWRPVWPASPAVA